HVADVTVEPHQHPAFDSGFVEDVDDLLWFHELAPAAMVAPIAGRDRGCYRKPRGVTDGADSLAVVEVEILNVRTKTRLRFADQNVAIGCWLLADGCWGDGGGLVVR